MSSFALRIKRAFEAELNKAEDVWVERKKDPQRYFKLRPSSMPYCGLRRALSAPEDLEKPRLENLATTYFTKVGHATHDAFQEMVGHGAAIVGNWKCGACKIWKMFDTFQTCPKCHKPMKYKELEVKYGNTVVGHTDGLFRLQPKLGRKSPHVVIDYKTTQLKNVKKKKSPFPYKSNVSQIETYIPLLEGQYEIEVVGWLLIYLARDTPFRYGRYLVAQETTAKHKVRLAKMIDRNVKVHRKMLVSETRKDFEVLKKYKLCSDREFYEDKVLDEYNPCPFADRCFKPEAMDKVIDATLKKHAKVYPIIQHASRKVRKEMEL